MSDDLPPGFVIQGQQQDDDLPPGFVVQGQQAAAAPKASFGLSDTWPARLAKSLYSAVTLPGDVYQGNVSMMGEDGHTNPEVINRAAELASLAGPTSAVAGSGPAIAAVAGLGKQVPVAPTREALLAAATQGYDKARGLGVDIDPSAVVGLGQRIVQDLDSKGISGELAPKTFSILARAGQAPPDSVATLSNLETLRRAFGHAASDFQNPTEQLAARAAKGHLDDYLAAIPDADVIRGPASEASQVLKDARGNYAAAKRSEQITDAVEAADLQAAAANSGQNIGNANRQRLKSILTSDRKSAGYSDEELAQMEQVIRGTGLGNAARYAGNLLGGGGGLGAAVVGGGAGAMTGGLGSFLPLVGVGLKKASDASVARGVSSLDEMVRLRSPLADILTQNRMPSTDTSATNQAIARLLLMSQPQPQY